MKNENGWTSDKVSRRELVAKDYRILLLIGDQLGDFLPLDETTLELDARKNWLTPTNICGVQNGS